jgi:hypothetical protein
MAEPRFVATNPSPTAAFKAEMSKDMADGDLHDQIARIEAEIDELAKTLDGCRKAMLFSKVAIAAGGIWILAYLLGAISFDPAAMIGAIAATIGGVVIFGSNSSTSKQTTAAMKAAETRRAELIDMIDLRTVGASGL